MSTLLAPIYIPMADLWWWEQKHNHTIIKQKHTQKNKPGNTPGDKFCSISFSDTIGKARLEFVSLSIEKSPGVHGQEDEFPPHTHA